MVLTAAHCAGYSSAVELGRYDRLQPLDEAAHERIEVAYEIKHPQWNDKTVDNDFMLIKLVQPSVNPKFSLITLNVDPNFPSIPGEKVTVMGWGDTEADPDVNIPSPELLQVELEYVPDDECRKRSGKVENDVIVNYAQRITGNMM